MGLYPVGVLKNGKFTVYIPIMDGKYPDDLKDKLDIAYLCEDEYGVETFLDWIVRILRSFIRWDPVEANYLKDEIEKLKKVPIDDREKIAIKILLNHIEGRTLLIIVENIGNIFIIHYNQFMMVI
jgi:hypothetical protein